MPVLNKIFGRTTPSDSENGAAALLSNQPMLVIVGSLEAGSRKDVLAYARGLAESLITAKDACFVDAVKHDGSWIFELHEGGPGRSIVQWAQARLAIDPTAKVNLPLAGNRVASISMVGGELVTIVFPPNEPQWLAACDESAGVQLGASLRPFFGTAAPFRNTAAVIFSLAAFFFIGSGAALFTRANLIDPERFVTRYAAQNTGKRTDISNLPSMQLALAKKHIKSDTGYLSFLKLEKGRWVWAQATTGSISQRGANE